MSYNTFSQLDPSKNQVSSKSLSDDANRLNMKKVQVNTQVRAMISFLEAASQITHIFLLWYNKGTHPSNLTLAIIIYDIFLPHSFLMNTSQNKNRIIELGWKNVLKNIIGLFNNSVESSENTETVDNAAGKEKSIKEKPKLITVNHTDIANSKSCNLATQTSLNESSISNVQVAGETSGYKSKNTEAPRHVELDVNSLEYQSQNGDISHLLLSKMMTTGNDEENYLVYFKKFIAHYDSWKRGNVVTDIELEDEFLSTLKQSNKYTNQNSGNTCKITRRTVSQDVVSEQAAEPSNGESNFTGNNRLINLKGEQEDRVSMRREILEDISSVCPSKNKETYENLIETLIDLEEGFLDES